VVVCPGVGVVCCGEQEVMINVVRRTNSVGIRIDNNLFLFTLTFLRIVFIS
jgi:hypothetical protein